MFEKDYKILGGRQKPLKFVLFILSIGVLVFLFRLIHVLAFVPSEINFQGKITDSNGINVADGQYDFRVRIYDQVSGGTAQVIASGSATVIDLSAVQVTNGIFNLKFSPLESALTGNGRYLQVCFNSQPVGHGSYSTNDGHSDCVTASPFDKVFTPRKKITSNPYSVLSKFLGSNNVFGGDAGSLFVTGEASQSGTGTISSSGTTVTGSGTAFTTELKVGSTITASSQTRIVIAIASNTSLTTDSAFSPTISGGTSFTYQIPILKVDNSSGTSQFIISPGGISLGTTPTTSAFLTVGKTHSSAVAGEQYGQNLSTVFSIADSGLKQSLRVNATASHTTGTQQNLIGILPLATGSGNGGTTTNAYALWSRVDSNSGHTIGNAYNLRVNDASGVGTITNQYGVYVNSLTRGSTSNYAFYADGSTQSYFGGNVGIGDTSPAAALTVGSGDLFQVNSSGAIAAATGITSSGTITFSGLNTAGIVHTNGSGVLSTSPLDLGGGATEVTGLLGIARGGTNGNFTPVAGTIAYGNGTAYQFNAAGTSGQILTSGGTGAPTWTNQSALAVSFASLTGGANTTAAMVIGTGGSLTVSGSGTINATTLLGSTWASPGAIGSSTPNSGAFTTLSSTGATTLGDNSSTVEIDSSSWNVSSAGALSGITGYTQASGGFSATGLSSGTISVTSANLALTTVTSGDINLTTPASNLANILTGNLKVGNATPSVTLNGEDAFVEGTFEVDGATRLDSTLTMSTMTQGSILFSGASGVVSQNNSRLFWDNSNNRLGIGTASPSASLQIAGNTLMTGDTMVEADGSSTTTAGSLPAISEGATLRAVAAGDNLCTDSLTAPTKIRIDGNGNCSSAGGVDTVLLGDATGAVTVTSAWAYVDTNASTTYNDGEDLYMDNAPTSAYNSGYMGLGSLATSTPLNINRINNATTDFFGSVVDVSQGSAGAVTTYGYRAIARATHTVGTLSGLQVNSTQGILSGNGGTTTTADILTANATIGAGHTVQDLNLVRVFQPTNSGSIGTIRGLAIGNISGATSNSYAIETNAGQVVFNQQGDSASDVRMEGDTDQNLFFLDASADSIGIGTSSPSSLFSVGASSQFQVNSSGAIAAATGVVSSGNIDLASLNAGGIVKAASSTGRLSIATAGTDYENPLTFTNGLTRTVDSVALGGTLTAGTTLAQAGFGYAQTFTGTTTTGFTYSAHSLSSGFGMLIGASSISSGDIFRVDRSNVTDSTAFTGRIGLFNYTSTWTGASSPTNSGQTLLVNRNLTMNSATFTNTVSGAVLRVSDAATLTAGAFTHSANAFEVVQSYTGNTGTAVNITTGGSGLVFRANDDGTLTDSTPFAIDATGNIGVGTASPASNAKLDVRGRLAIGNTSFCSSITSMLCFDSTTGIKINFIDGFNKRISVDNTNFEIVNVESGASNTVVSMMIDTGASSLFRVRNESSTDLFTVNGSTGNALVVGDFTTRGIISNDQALLQIDGGSGITYFNSSVGIGTSSPDEALNVIGNVRIDDNDSSGGAGCFRYNASLVVMQYSNDCTTYQSFSSSTGGGWTDDGTVVRLTTSTDRIGVSTATVSTGAAMGFGSAVGQKIALWDNGSGAMYGFGIQSNLMQIHANSTSDRVGIGYGTSASFTETFTVKAGAAGVGDVAPSGKMEVNGSVSMTLPYGGTGNVGLYVNELNTLSNAQTYGIEAVVRDFTTTSTGTQRLTVHGVITDGASSWRTAATLGQMDGINNRIYAMSANVNSCTSGYSCYSGTFMGGYVGIGTQTPEHPLDISSANTGEGIRIENTSAVGTNSGGTVVIRTSGLPTANGHRLGGMFFGSGNTDTNTAAVIAFASQSWTAGVSTGTFLSFETTTGTTRSEKMRVGAGGAIQLGMNTSGASTTTLDIGGTGNTTGVCHTGGATATDNVDLVDCTGTAGADYMEMYSVDSNVDMGDIVASSNNYVVTKHGDRVAKLTKANSVAQFNVIGIASDKEQAGDFNSIGYNIEDYDNPYPIALNGRVLVKVSNINGPIENGAPVTSSAIPGFGQKATSAGFIVGKALEDFDPANGKGIIDCPLGTPAGVVCGRVMVYVNNTYYNPGSSSNDGSAWTLNGSELSTLVNVKIAGDISASKASFKSLDINLGNLTIDENGKLITKSDIKANGVEAKTVKVDKVSINQNPTSGDSTVGVGTITAGSQSVIISNSNITTNAKVFVTITSDAGDSLRVINKQNGVGFTVKLNTVSSENVTFDYWIVME